MCNAGYAEKDFSSAFKFLREQENKWELLLKSNYVHKNSL